MFLTMLLKVHCDFWELDHEMTENRYHIQTSVATEPSLGKECCQESVIKINYCLCSLPSGGGKVFHSLNLCISFLSGEKLRQSTVFSNSPASVLFYFQRYFQRYVVKAFCPTFF